MCSQKAHLHLYQTRKIQEHQCNFSPNLYQLRVFLVYLRSAFQVLLKVQTLVSET